MPCLIKFWGIDRVRLFFLLADWRARRRSPLPALPHSAEPQGQLDGISSNDKTVLDKDMLREMACDCFSCSRIGDKIKSPLLCENAICGVYYHRSRDAIHRSARETCNLVEWVSYTEFVHDHERSHYKCADGYHCLEEGCNHKYSTWSDLTRHTLSVHCQNPPIYSCPEIGCQYHGDNGFKRKDKLKSHIDKVHHGRVAPGRAGRRIQPAIANANNGAGYRA